MSAAAAARKRAEKTAKRKKQLAERRQAEIAHGRAHHRDRMRYLAAAPVHSCLLQKGALAADGAGILIRRASR
jgi:hypothetical protein